MRTGSRLEGDKTPVMTFELRYYLAFFPLAALGLFRWAMWLIRRVPAALYKPVENDFWLPISVVVPVYQEDPVIFARAIESWLANGVEEIVLVIDATDETCIAIACRYPVTIVVTDVPGKRHALRTGWEYCTTPLVALVDSDTIWAFDVAVEVCKPFADPKIGGVGTRQNVYNPKGFLPRINDIFLDYRYFDENAAQTVMGRAVSCLSGRTAIYRREILLDISEEFMSETFWGVPCMSGDDKRLTSLLLERGYDTYLQRTARVWSTFPNTWKVFYKQRLRWARNTWRSDLRALSSRWVWKRPFLAFTMLDKAMGGFTLFFAPTFMILALINRNWFFVWTLLGWWWISRCIKVLPHLRRRPQDFFLMPGYILATFAMGAIKLNALLTIRKQRWLTRQVQVENGQVVRTAATAMQGGE